MITFDWKYYSGISKVNFGLHDTKSKWRKLTVEWGRTGNVDKGYKKIGRLEIWNIFKGYWERATKIYKMEYTVNT